MRIIKAIVLFCFSMGMVSSCFEPPEMSSIPRISFKSIQFKEIGTIADYDSLIVTFDFQDGDGNIGLRNDVPEDLEAPFNSAFYYVADGTGDTTRIVARKIDIYDVIDDINLPAFPGKMVTVNTRNTPEYAYLPPYSASECFYSPNTELVIQAALNLVDPSYNILDTLTLNDPSDPNHNQQYYLVKETFLYKKNPYHNNIELKFYIFTNGSWIEYDFFKNTGSCESYDGRFPPLTMNGSLTSGSQVEGVFRYGIGNTSFIAAFGSNRVRVTVRIRDRALNNSNLMVYDFELDDIR